MTTSPWLARLRLFVGCFTLFVIGTDLFVISPLLPLIAHRFDVNAAVAGWMVTAFSATYMVCAPFLGSVSDRWGRREVMVTGLVVFAVANAVTSVAGTFALLLASRMIAGVAAAMISPSIYAITGDVAPPVKRATWLALVGLGLLVALSVGAPLGGLLSGVVGWEGVFLIIAASSLGLAPINALVWKGAPRPAAAARADLSLAILLRGVGPTVFWSVAVFGVYTFLATGLRATAHFTAAQVAAVLAVYGAGAAVGSLSGGRLADRFGARTTATVSVASLSVTFVLIRALLPNVQALYVGFALVACFSQAFFPAQQARLAAEFPERRGAMMAWNNSALYLGIFLGSLVGGQVMLAGGFESLLVACAGCGLVGALTNAYVATPRRSAAAAAVPTVATSRS